MRNTLVHTINRSLDRESNPRPRIWQHDRQHQGKFCVKVQSHSSQNDFSTFFLSWFPTNSLCNIENQANAINYDMVDDMTGMV
jgi:hypothetical protein